MCFKCFKGKRTVKKACTYTHYHVVSVWSSSFFLFFVQEGWKDLQHKSHFVFIRLNLLEIFTWNIQVNLLGSISAFQPYISMRWNALFKTNTNCWDKICLTFSGYKFAKTTSTTIITKEAGKKRNQETKKEEVKQIGREMLVICTADSTHGSIIWSLNPSYIIHHLSYNT